MVIMAVATNYFMSLSLDFFICRIEIVIIMTHRGALATK